MKNYPRRQKPRKPPAEDQDRIRKVFISYSHDSPEHSAAVLTLSNRLRADGIDAALDQYDDSPPLGWPFWMEEQVRNADFVLIVCTDIYRYHVEHFESISTGGKGVLWESNLVYNLVYLNRLRNQKFIPILLSQAWPESNPTPLKGFTYYNPETPDGYEGLYRLLVGDPLIKRPPLGPRRRLPKRNLEVLAFREERAAERKSWLQIRGVKLPSTSNALFSGVTDETLSATKLPTSAIVGMDKLAGRAFLAEKLGKNIDAWHPASLEATMVILDLDKLTQINRVFGSRAGDTVLYVVHQIVSHSKSDYSGRCGDDTFYAIFLHISAERAQQLAEDICAEICDFDWNDLAPGLRVTSSIGVAHFDKNDAPIDWPIRAAIGMRSAKEDGGNRVSAGPAMLPLADGAHRVSRVLSDYFS
jgi:diguanylate cyclase (GGDEF)-like protein